jgi:hypothetical protein
LEEINFEIFNISENNTSGVELAKVLRYFSTGKWYNEMSLKN